MNFDEHQRRDRRYTPSLIARFGLLFAGFDAALPDAPAARRSARAQRRELLKCELAHVGHGFLRNSDFGAQLKRAAMRSGRTSPTAF